MGTAMASRSGTTTLILLLPAALMGVGRSTLVTAPTHGRRQCFVKVLLTSEGSANKGVPGPSVCMDISSKSHLVSWMDAILEKKQKGSEISDFHQIFKNIKNIKNKSFLCFNVFKYSLDFPFLEPRCF